jgi:hypothetical protein
MELEVIDGYEWFWYKTGLERSETPAVQGMRAEKLFSNFPKCCCLAGSEKISVDMMECIVTDRAVGIGPTILYQ